MGIAGELPGLVTRFESQGVLRRPADPGGRCAALNTYGAGVSVCARWIDTVLFSSPRVPALLVWSPHKESSALWVTGGDTGYGHKIPGRMTGGLVTTASVTFVMQKV